MANSIRTPREGLTNNSRRIAEAVDDEEWQLFRVSMKGKSTAEKLRMLHEYYDREYVNSPDPDTLPIEEWEREKIRLQDVRIRVDNYIKALCRGGQLWSGETLQSVLNVDWKPVIRKG